MPIDRRPRPAMACLLAAVAAAGCGLSETSRLAADSAAVLYDDEGDDVLLTSPARRKDGQSELRIERVPSGTRVTVLEDAPAVPPVRAELRAVRVRVADGPRAGLAGDVGRYELRPSR